MISLSMQKLKHWQIFLLFFFPLFVSLYIENEYYNELAKATSFILIIIHFVSINAHLNNVNETKNSYFFIFNCLYMIVVTVLIAGLGGEILGEYSKNYLVIMIVMLFYFLVAFIQVADHLATQLRVAEGKEVDNYKQSIDTMLFFMWPIGLWFFQSRINRIH